MISLKKSFPDNILLGTILKTLLLLTNHGPYYPRKGWSRRKRPQSESILNGGNCATVYRERFDYLWMLTTKLKSININLFCYSEQNSLINSKRQKKKSKVQCFLFWVAA